MHKDNEIYSLAQILQEATLQKGKEDTRLYERYFKVLLKNLHLNSKIFKKGSKYEIPAKYVPFAHFLIKELDCNGYVRKLVSEKSIAVDYIDKILFYHHYLIWIKKYLFNQLNNINASEKWKAFVDTVMSTLPDELKTDTPYMIALEDEPFDINSDEEYCDLYNAVFVNQDTVTLNMCDIMCLTRFIYEYIGYPTARLLSLFYTQTDAIIKRFCIRNPNPDKRAIEFLSDELCMSGLREEYGSEIVVSEYFENWSTDVKSKESEIDSKLDILNEKMDAPTDDEDEFFEPYKTQWDALEDCKVLHQNYECDAMMKEYLSTLASDELKAKVKSMK